MEEQTPPEPAAQPDVVDTPPAAPYSLDSERDAVMERALAALAAPGEEGETPDAGDPERKEPTPNSQEPAPDAQEDNAEQVPEPQNETEEPGPAAEGEEPPPLTSADYAQLAEDRRRFEEERRAWEQQRQSASPRLEALSRLAEARGGDAVKALAELGIDYAELTKAVLADPKLVEKKPAVDEATKTEIQQLREQLEEHRRQQLTMEATRGVRQLIENEASSERWELLRAYPDYDREVVAFIEKDWIARGAARDAQGNAVGTLTFEAAADSLERYLFEQATRFSTAEKVRRHYGAPEQTPASPPTSPDVPQANGSAAPPATVPAVQTLTTAHGSTAAPVTDTTDPEACRSRALAVLERQFGREQ